MPNPEKRRTLLANLEKARGTRVIAYITGDRQNAGSRIGMDVFPYFYEVLKKMGPTEKIDILLYSTGGVTMAAWGLANLIREYCKEFAVLIPFKAQSTATLLALGANEILMSSLGQLSPVDPTVNSPFNPVRTDPTQQGIPQIIPVSVEDVVAYFDLAREEAGIEGTEAMVEVFKKLSDSIQPMALGSVYRAKEQIKLLARKLLAFHMDEKGESARIDSIVKSLTRELFSHDYLISRREAKDAIKLKIVETSEELEGLLWSAFSAYSDDIELNTPYNVAIALGKDSGKTINIDAAYIESRDLGFVYRTTKEVRKLAPGQVPGIPGPAFQEQVLKQGWIAV